MYMFGGKVLTRDIVTDVLSDAVGLLLLVIFFQA